VDGLLADAVPPRAEPAATDGPAPAGPGRAEDAAAEGEPARLLVVDDDEEGRELLARRLARQGYRVSSAADGESALRRLEEEPFDLVLLDLEMPGLGGMETLASLRRRLSPGELPVVMVTGRADSAGVVEALARGANDYVVKPFDPAVLEARVRTHASLSRLGRDAALLARQLELRSRFLRQVFGRYLSDEVVESLLESPLGLRLGGERRTVTVLMADLRGFSAHAERLPPEEVMALLNLYLSSMTEVIAEAGGTIDEFLGDAILVLFGAPLPRPDHARAALRCALRMQQAMEDVRDRLAAQGLPRVEMGVGVHTGEAVVGNIGSERRAKFGAVGRSVNLAARIEGLTAGGQVLVSADALAMIGEPVDVEDTFEFQPKGEPEPIVVHAVRGMGGADGPELPELTADLRPLQPPLPLALTPFDGKRLAGDARRGEIVRLSRRAAEVRLAGGLELRGDVQLQLPCERPGEPLPILYAKVVAAPEGDGGAWRLRFTWVPPETARRIGEALGEPSA
jgi:adenylate cyclase